MIKIIRYSLNGFEPQKQSHHIKNFEYWKSMFTDEIKKYPEHLQNIIREQAKIKTEFYQNHLDDLQEGLWVFLNGHKNRQSLNHLKRRVPCWEAEILDDTRVYDANLSEIVLLTDSIVAAYGCYIPKRLLKNIYNVKQRVEKRA